VVAGLVAEGVVDPLEVVEIERHQGHVPAVATEPLELAVENFLERPIVEQPGERVVVGKGPDLLPVGVLVEEQPDRAGHRNDQPVDEEAVLQGGRHLDGEEPHDLTCVEKRCLDPPSGRPGPIGIRRGETLEPLDLEPGRRGVDPVAGRKGFRTFPRDDTPFLTCRNFRSGGGADPHDGLPGQGNHLDAEDGDEAFDLPA